ncbi:MAG: hypothetical protein PF487_00045, partial [Bacteroidales bacterium]|nr:hypothetical protein [Bacteroidales bacterium]
MFRETYSLSIIIALFFLFQGCKRVKHEVNTTYSTDIIATEISLKTDGYLFGGSAILDPNL